jgi:hypothetical protein
MLRRLIILGTRGLAREVALVVEQITEKERRWTISGFWGFQIMKLKETCEYTRFWAMMNGFYHRMIPQTLPSVSVDQIYELKFYHDIWSEKINFNTRI